MRFRTPKRAAEERLYRARVKEWIKGKSCQLCYRPATETHHSRGRSNKMLLLEKWWIPLCEFHHRRCHNEPNWARTMGVLCEKGKWLNPD